MVIDELSNQFWSRTNATNYSANGYPTRIATITKPSGDGVVAMGDGGSYAPKHLLLLPYGVGSATNTFGIRILCWAPTALGIGLPLWIPEELATYAITVGSGTGVAGADLTTTSLFATTITCTGGPTFVTAGAAPICPDWFQISPGSNANGLICIESLGFPLLEVIFTTGASITSCNSLYRKK